MNDLKKNLDFCSKSDLEGFEYYLVSVILKEVTEGQSKCFIDYFVKSIFFHLKTLGSNGLEIV